MTDLSGLWRLGADGQLHPPKKRAVDDVLSQESTLTVLCADGESIPINIYGQPVVMKQGCTPEEHDAEFNRLTTKLQRMKARRNR